MSYQEIYQPLHTIIGADSLEYMVEVVKKFGGKKGLVVTDKGLAKIGTLKHLTDIMDKTGLAYDTYAEVEPNPTAGMVRACHKKYVDAGCDYFVALGGGSAMDCTKGASIMATNGGDVKDYEGVNKCIECGFCEVNCVSCGFTLSSRTRIVVQREIARRKAAGEPWEALEKAFKYPGQVTCAGDGLCSTSCPMHINVGDMTHELRQERLGAAGNWLGAWVAEHFRGTKTLVRGTLGVAHAANLVLGNTLMGAVGKGLHAMGLPLWTPETPLPLKMRKPASPESPLKVVYFPSCLNQTMAQAPADTVKPLVEETVELLGKAGFEVIFPPRMEKLCCGTIWESKGMPEVADKKLRELEESLWEASAQGEYPVLCDQSPCLHRMRKGIKTMHLYEPAEFLLRFVAPRLEFHPTDTPVAVHVTCSTRLMGLKDSLVELARKCSNNVYVPEEIGCCAYAGDKGMTHPELNAYALRKLKQALKEHGIKEGYSNSRTCEIGLSTNGGITYRSIVYLVNACTTASSS